MGKVSENLDQIKIQFQVHGDYMQYLDSNQEEIGKVNVFLNQTFDITSWDNLVILVPNVFKQRLSITIGSESWL